MKDGKEDEEWEKEEGGGDRGGSPEEREAGGGGGGDKCFASRGHASHKPTKARANFWWRESVAPKTYVAPRYT